MTAAVQTDLMCQYNDPANLLDTHYIFLKGFFEDGDHVAVMDW